MIGNRPETPGRVHLCDMKIINCRPSRKRRAATTAGLAFLLAAGLTPPATAADGLAGFQHQKLTWQQCSDPPPPDPSELPEDGVIIDPWKGQWKLMECAQVTVPLDYRNPSAGKLSIDVTRIKATDQARRRGVLLLNPGGPGGSGTTMPLGARTAPIAKHFDLIGFAPRGTSSTNMLKCETVKEKLPDTTRPTEEQFAQYTAYARAMEAACQRAGGGIRPFINTANAARDMDLIRTALGESKINYLGYSYGTYLGAVYGSLYPQHLNRSVLDSSIHPQWMWREQAKQQSVAARFNVEQWAAWTGERDNTYHLGKSQAEVLATTEALAAKLATRSVPFTRPRPEDWPVSWPKEFSRNELDRFLAQGTQPRPIWDVVAEVIGEVRQAAEKSTALSPDSGKAIGLLHQKGIARVRDGVYETVTCEADWPTDLSTYYEDMRAFRDYAPYADGNGSGIVGVAPNNCTFRSFTPPESLVPLKRDGYPTGIVIQADGDPATQYDGGPAMAATLADQLISVRDSGSHGHYGTNKCVTERVDNYLINGILPSSRSECAAEPRPQVPADKAAPPAGSPAKDDTGRSTSSVQTSKEARVQAVAEKRLPWR
ncbi:alpha/beta fold hydrolase [Amycolatopsis jejuensis]|uniref:alpha/beta fold hydrolase n=1 Tax=Amycolatopsis jejuensis TaxID=330084 RepID=UPI00068C1688|nr:alpha/beta fold hydrolase [Amycolatopsis jejuensis]